MNLDHLPKAFNYWHDSLARQITQCLGYLSVRMKKHAFHAAGYKYPALRAKGFVPMTIGMR